MKILIASLCVLSSLLLSGYDPLALDRLIIEDIYSKELQNEPSGSYIINGISQEYFASIKKYGNYRWQTNIVFKVDSNLNYVLVTEPIMKMMDDNFVVSDSTRYSFCLFKFGECVDEEYGTAKRNHLYLPNNIFTEEIKLKNGFAIVLTNKFKVNTIITPSGDKYLLADYEFIIPK